MGRRTVRAGRLTTLIAGAALLALVAAACSSKGTNENATKGTSGELSVAINWANRKAAFDNQGAFVNLIAPSECNKSLVPGKSYSFFLMPKYDQSAPNAQFVSGDLFAVAKDSKNAAVAKALARYLGSADGQAIWAKRGGFVAPNARVPMSVYPNANDVKAAQLWPRNPATPAGYDLDDFIGGEIQSTEREALQQLVRDHDAKAFIATMMKVDTRAAG
jgi:ABC-type glycerol-3-phosphate transport system substrate-binding protein